MENLNVNLKGQIRYASLKKGPIINITIHDDRIDFGYLFKTFEFKFGDITRIKVSAFNLFKVYTFKFNTRKTISFNLVTANRQKKKVFKQLVSLIKEKYQV